jgi:hypothetical protein
MGYLGFVVLVVPAAIGLLAAMQIGPNRGVLLGGVLMLSTVFTLLLFQITIPETGPGSEMSRFSYAQGLMRFEWSRWLPSFLAGAAIGSLIFRARRPAAS